MQVPPGHAILFCGYTMHTGVPITAGTRYVLTGFVGGRPLSFTPAHGLVHTSSRPRSSGTSSRVSSTSARLWKLSVHSTAPSQARYPLPNCMLSASVSSQARCPHFVWSGQRACKCSAWRPHPSLHRHAAHSVWSGQRACKCSARRPYPTPLFTGTLPTPFGAGSNDFPSPHLGMNRERLCRAYGGVRGEPDCL